MGHRHGNIVPATGSTSVRRFHNEPYPAETLEDRSVTLAATTVAANVTGCTMTKGRSADAIGGRVLVAEPSSDTPVVLPSGVLSGHIGHIKPQMCMPQAANLSPLPVPRR